MKLLRTVMFKRTKKAGPAMAALLAVYRQRPDLQEVYPEAQSGEYARLITWAANASSGGCKDSSQPLLQPYAQWYRSNFQVVAAPAPWDTIRKTWAASANPSPIAAHVMQHRHATDISFHLPMLSLLIVEFGLKNIVELGTRSGNSTLVLLEAAKHIGGKVVSVDVDPCVEANSRVAAAKLNDYWTFICGNDLDVQPSQLPQPIDLLFIDTNHLYRYTIQELKKYSEYLRPGGWILLHDFVSFPGVNRAVEEFVKTMPSTIHFYPFIHQNGLAVLRCPE